MVAIAGYVLGILPPLLTAGDGAQGLERSLEAAQLRTEEATIRCAIAGARPARRQSSTPCACATFTTIPSPAKPSYPREHAPGAASCLGIGGTGPRRATLITPTGTSLRRRRRWEPSSWPPWETPWNAIEASTLGTTELPMSTTPLRRDSKLRGNPGQIAWKFAIRRVQLCGTHGFEVRT